jgi:hypothetical protein
MSVQQHMAVAMSSVALAGAAAVYSAGTVAPASADVEVAAVAPQPLISGAGGGGGGAAAVGPGGVAAGGGAGGGAGRIIYMPNQSYNPRFLPQFG